MPSDSTSDVYSDEACDVDEESSCLPVNHYTIIYYLKNHPAVLQYSRVIDHPAGLFRMQYSRVIAVLN